MAQPEGEKLAVALLHAMTIMATDPMVGEALAVELTDDMVRANAPTPLCTPCRLRQRGTRALWGMCAVRRLPS